MRLSRHESMWKSQKQRYAGSTKDSREPHHRADNKKFPSIRDLAEFPSLPQLAEAKNKAHDMAEQIARLEDQNKVLQAQINEDANLRTDMVESLTDFGADLSSDGKKTPRNLLLKFRDISCKLSTRTNRPVHLLLITARRVALDISAGLILFVAAQNHRLNTIGRRFSAAQKIKAYQPPTRPEDSPSQLIQDPATTSSDARRVFSCPRETGFRTPPISSRRAGLATRPANNSW